jgi:hypothetical protein
VVKIAKIHRCAKCDEYFELESFMMAILEREEAVIESVVCYDCLMDVEIPYAINEVVIH